MSKITTLSFKKIKCRGCGRRPLMTGSPIYCRYCHKLAWRMRIKQIPPKAREAVWDYLHKNDYRCYYTGMLLELDDDTSPWFCDLDHWIPRDSRKVVLTSALLNEMKSDLSQDEFWFYIRQLADHHSRGTTVIKINLKYWDRNYHKRYKLPLKLMTEFRATQHNPNSVGIRVTLNGTKFCRVCGRPVWTRRSNLCRQCKLISCRMLEEDLPHDSKQSVWKYVHQYDYICYYTKLRLELTNFRSPWYCVLDHWIPHHPQKIVLTCALFNEMKSDMTEEEFWSFALQLDKFERNGTPVRKRKLKYWKRPYGR